MNKPLLKKSCWDKITEIHHEEAMTNFSRSFSASLDQKSSWKWKITLSTEDALYTQEKTYLRWNFHPSKSQFKLQAAIPANYTWGNFLSVILEDLILPLDIHLIPDEDCVSEIFVEWQNYKSLSPLDSSVKCESVKKCECQHFFLNFATNHPLETFCSVCKV